MPVPDYETYCKMLDRAREKQFAYHIVYCMKENGMGYGY